MIEGSRILPARASNDLSLWTGQMPIEKSDVEAGCATRGVARATFKPK